MTICIRTLHDLEESNQVISEWLVVSHSLVHERMRLVAGEHRRWPMIPLLIMPILTTESIQERTIVSARKPQASQAAIFSFDGTWALPGDLMVQGIKFRGAAGVGARCTSNAGTSVLLKEESRALCLPIVPCRSQNFPVTSGFGEKEPNSGLGN